MKRYSEDAWQWLRSKVRLAVELLIFSSSWLQLTDEVSLFRILLFQDTDTNVDQENETKEIHQNKKKEMQT